MSKKYYYNQLHRQEFVFFQSTGDTYLEDSMYTIHKTISRNYMTNE